MSKTFRLTDDQRMVLNRKMKVGFCLIKREDLAKFNTRKKVEVVYNPESIPRTNLLPVAPLVLPQITSIISGISVRSQVSSEADLNLNKDLSFVQSLTRPKPSTILNEGSKIKNTERLKAIVQKFKKHKKFSLLTNGISKAGKSEILYSLVKIEEEIKKHFHTLDTFKESVLNLIDMIKDIPTISELALEIRTFFENLITEEKQIQFETSLQDLQKNVDKITRELGETKQQGQWYYKKKKRNDKYLNEIQTIYICDLIKQLPKSYLIGVWEIIYEQPFRELKQFKLKEIDVSALKPRKIREIEYYVKLTLTTLKKSKLKKKQKIEKKIAKEVEKLKQLTEKDKQVQDIFENKGMEIQEEENMRQKKEEIDKKQMQVQNPPEPRVRTAEQEKEIAEIEERISALEKQASISSSDSSMITDDEEDFD